MVDYSDCTCAHEIGPYTQMSLPGVAKFATQMSLQTGPACECYKMSSFHEKQLYVALSSLQTCNSQSDRS